MPALGAAVGGSGSPTKEEHLVTISAGYSGAPYQSPWDSATFSNALNLVCTVPL